MPDQNFYSNPSQDQGNIPPPPPSQDQQVGIRSMSSDLQSIQQSGGEAPQSQIVNAPELSSLKQEQPAPSYQYQAPQSAPEIQPQAPAPDMGTGNMEVPPKSSFSFKTILLIVGIIIVAGGLGFGAYYLISNLNSQPQVDLTPTPSTNNGLPLTLPDATTSSSTLNTPIPIAVPPLIHASLISNPTKSEQIVLTDTTLAGFKAAINNSAKEKLVAGNVKDLSFVNSSSTPIESYALVDAFLGASPSSVVSPDSVKLILDRDFTSWLYADKVGGNKFGLVLKLKPQTNLDQAKATMVQFLEQNPMGIASLFVASSTPPTAVEFKDGQVEGISVRFLAFNAKTANVFEYGWMSIGTDNYLVMTTSYNQMVDIVKRLKAIQPLAPAGVSTSTTTATTSTSTGN